MTLVRSLILTRSQLARLKRSLSSNINMAEEGVVVTLVNQVSEERGGPIGRHCPSGSVERLLQDEEPLERGESASEGDVEVEQDMLEDNSLNGGDDANGALTNITFDVRKRTLIMLWQRTILEEFYRAGMTSASMQLQSLHLDAAEKTGLDNTVIKVR